MTENHGGKNSVIDGMKRRIERMTKRADSEARAHQKEDRLIWKRRNTKRKRDKVKERKEETMNIPIWKR